jgi:3-dehydroquinate dehydratase-1
MITIGSLELGKRPSVAAVVDEIVPLQDLAGLAKRGVDLIEVRVDLIDKPLDCLLKCLADLRACAGLPLIGTVRENERTAPDRAAVFGAIMPLVDCIDIELGAPIAQQVQALAKTQGKTVIVSEHDFEKTPGVRGLQAIVDRAMAQGAHIVKVVTMAKTEEDAWRLLRFAKKCTVPIVAFAMGEAGAFSRIRACEYGSLFTYGYVTRAVAPGQISADELVRKIARSSP